jgi:hypothetical protein
MDFADVERHGLADHQRGGVRVTNSVNIHALALKAASTLNIASGVVTVTQQYHVLAAESGTTDDVDTISMGFTNLAVKGNTYYPLLCVTADAGDVITLKDGTGNLSLPNADDIAVDPGSFVWLLWNGTAWTAPIAAATAGTLNDAVILAPDSDTRNDITAGADDETPLRLKPNSGTQSAPLLEIVNESDTPTASISKDGEIAFDMLKVNTATTLTIASGAVTITGGHHIIAAESGTSDLLETINGGVTGQFLLIEADTGDTINVQQTSGNISFADASTSTSADHSLSGSAQMLLYYTGSVWQQIGFNGVREININTVQTSGQWEPVEGGTGTNNNTNTEGDTLLSNGVNGDYVTSPLPPGIRNHIIDPMLDYWPDGTSFTDPSNLQYLSVNTFINRITDGGTLNVDVTREAFTLGQTDVPGNPRYYMRLAGSVEGSPGGNEYVAVNVPVEYVRTLSGLQANFSLYLKGGSAGTIALAAAQSFGTGGSPSSAVFVTGFNVAITTSWVRYDVTLTVPSVSGKTLGTNNNDLLNLWIYKQAGASIVAARNLPGAIAYTDTLDIACLQLTEGAIRTAFELRPKAFEQRLIERYYWKNPGGSTQTLFGAGFNQLTTQAAGFVQFPTLMRAAPTFAQSGSFQVQHAATATAITSLTADSITQQSARLLGTVASGLTAGQGSMIRAAGDAAANIAFSARL